MNHLVSVKKLALLFRMLSHRLGGPSYALNAILNSSLIGIKTALKALFESHLQAPTPLDFKKKGYIIYTPNYSRSAGIRCLFKLCHLLNKNHYPAYVTHPELMIGSLEDDAPIISVSYAKRLVQQGWIVVYPETVSGNPLNAKKVCRWVLNSPGLFGGDSYYDSKEAVFIYSDAFKNYVQNKITGKLYVPSIDQTIFYMDSEKNQNRSLECFYLGKSSYREGYFDPKSTFEITRHSPQKSELGKLFRHSKVLYCFDNSSVLCYEAILCGCPVIIIPDGTQTREDYEKLELGMNGMAWGPEEFQTMHFDPEKFRQHLASLQVNFDHQLLEFIQKTQQL